LLEIERPEKRGTGKKKGPKRESAKRGLLDTPTGELSTQRQWSCEDRLGW